VYGTVLNNYYTVEQSLKTIWGSCYEIVSVDSFSTYGTYAKLLEFKKEYNIKLFRLRSTRGDGRQGALLHCPLNSVEALILLVIENDKFQPRFD
jgi:hypothetical protein